ncbi:MAG: hypothetical protein AB7J19_10760 [Beijerinckiaceae bacterium]
MQANEAAVRAAVERIVTGRTFGRSRRCRDMLTHLVEASLRDSASELKAYTIAVEAFGRDESFDADNDSFLRVQAGRLRTLLDTYYAEEGRGDPVRISMPKGGYRLEFLDRTGQKQADAAPASALPGKALPLINTVLLYPFSVQRQESDQPDFARSLANGLASSLNRTGLVYLKMGDGPAATAISSEGARVLANTHGVRWIMSGDIAYLGAVRRTSVQVFDGLSGGVVFNEIYDADAASGLASVDDTTDAILSDIRPYMFSVARRWIESKPESTITPFEYFILSTWAPGAGVDSLAWEKERVVLARKALAGDPNMVLAYSVLADKLAYLANVDPPSDTPANRQEAAEAAEMAARAAAGSSEAMFNISVYYWHTGVIAASARAAERTAELSPRYILARFLAKAVPYTARIAPQAMIDALIELDRSLSPSNPIRWVTLAWIARLHINNGDYAAAVEAGRDAHLIFHTPDTVYQLAAALVQTGEVAAARELIERERESWPNLDPHHYARIAIPRRCGNGAAAAHLRRIYGEMADAVEPRPEQLDAV